MSTKMVDLHGNVMMEIMSLERKADDLVMKGKMMGTMPGTIYLKPEEAWNGLKILSWQVMRYLPLYLFRGWCRRQRK